MIYVLVYVLITLVFVVTFNRVKSSIGHLAGIIETLSRQIMSLRSEVASLKQDMPAAPVAENPVAAVPPVTPYVPVMQDVVPASPVPPDPDPEETPEIIYLRQRPHEAAAPEPQSEAGEDTMQEPVHLHQPVAAFTDPVADDGGFTGSMPNELADTSWLSRNPDLEKFIGENLINKIGIAILVLGIGFFVKYAIDQNWINEVGRVSIGMGCGAILVGLAHYLRNSYRSFSSVLAGGGIAVFYFTIAFAFHQYHLLSQTAAFVVMVAITAFAVALSVLYDKLELAVIAALGGFITPFMVATGDGNYIVLFSYLIILNVGLLSLAWFKRWRSLNIIALFFTALIYGGWLVGNLVQGKAIVYPAALLFASVFYFIFMGMNMIYQVRNKLQFRIFDFFILLFINCAYYAAGMAVLHEWNHGAYQGIFTLALGMVNLGLAWYLFKSGRADRNLLYLLIGLTATFVTLTIPIQLHGHAITLFWSAEFVLLYWLSVQSGIRLFRQSSVLVAALALGSLMLDWSNAMSAATGLSLIFTGITGIVTNVVTIAALAGHAALVRRSGEEQYFAEVLSRFVIRLEVVLAVVLLYFTFIFGVNLAFRSLTSYDVPNVYHRLITIVFALVLVVLLQRKVIRASPFYQVALLIGYFVFYLCSGPLMAHLRDGVLAGHYHWFHLAGHWLCSVLMLALLYRVIQGIRRNTEVFEPHRNMLCIAMALIPIIFLSMEMLQLYILIGYRRGNTAALEQQYGKAGLSVLWGLCSFALMWLGMRHGQKTLRIISLVLFSLVLLKLFIFDISGISEGGKIFAFILLGVLLLTVSFMYQKLKKMIIDDVEK